MLESSNWAIKGAAFGARDRLNQQDLEIVTVATEHVAALKTCVYLKSRGFKLTVVSVDSRGVVNLKELESALTSRTVLVSMMYVNNETGTVQPVARVAEMIKQKSRNALFHCDASQAIGRLEVDVRINGCGSHDNCWAQVSRTKRYWGFICEGRYTCFASLTSWWWTGVSSFSLSLSLSQHQHQHRYGMRPGTENTLLRRCTRRSSFDCSS